MHLALYRKYRPRTFAAVISQPHITTTLQNQIKSGQIGHAYLLTGSRGTGKTTCAKILAKAVNCLSPIDGNPCENCENCKAVNPAEGGQNAGSACPDIQEIDAASNNGVDDIRALREEAGYLPSELKYKVYIIDEVHMLSASAFNALLKTLEEPPPHVIFILATTEIHKIPATVLSRCQRYEFNRINSEESADALIKIAAEEKITLEKDAALLISRLSDGGMRDALSLLDVAASENDVITQQIVRDCAGIAGKEHLFAITDAIANRDGKSALTITAGLYAKSKDPTRLIDELLQHFRNLMIVKLMPGDFSLLTVLPEEIEDYTKQACLFTVEKIIDCLVQLEECLRLKGRKVEAEICLMRLCLTDKPVLPVQASEVVQPSPTPIPISEPPPIPMPESPPPPVSEPIPPLPPTAPTISEPLSEWESILAKLDAYKASMLEESQAGISGNNIVITGGEVLQYFFDNPDNLAAIEKAAREATGKDYKVVFDNVGSQALPILPASPQALPVLPASPELNANGVTKINQFLDDVKASGIQITIQ